MKRTLSLIGLTFICAKVFAAPTVETIDIDKAYVPVGFDDNDRVQIAIQGELPGTCYRIGVTKFDVNAEKKEIRLTQTAYKYGGPCLYNPVPYPEYVTLGLVPAVEGGYAIVDTHSNKMIGKLSVKAATKEEPDDFAYANVQDAYLTGELFHPKKLHLQYTLPDRCTKLESVKVTYFKEVIVVQPITSPTSDDCAGGARTEQKVVDLAGGLTGNALIHVRSANGQAVNKIVLLD